MAGLLEEGAVLFTPVAGQSRLVYRLLRGQWVSANNQVQLVARFSYERHHQAAVKVSRPDVINLPGQEEPFSTTTAATVPKPRGKWLNSEGGPYREVPSSSVWPHRDKAVGLLFVLCNCLWRGEEQDTIDRPVPTGRSSLSKSPIAECYTGLQRKETKLRVVSCFASDQQRVGVS